MLVIQEPGTAALLKELDRAARGATCGGGAFAFATKAGVESFFEQKNVKTLLEKNGEFNLIIGIDAITNIDAVEALKKQQKKYSTLNIQIFKHQENSGTIFHPKFSWFQTKTNGKLVTGSGNLTQSGLGGSSGKGGNWEAFTLLDLGKQDITDIATQWAQWITQATKSGYLFALNDPDVAKKAMENNRKRPARKPSKPKSGKTSSSEETPDTLTIEGSEYPDLVQIIELSRNRGTGFQADIGKDIVSAFFGFKKGQKVGKGKSGKGKRGKGEEICIQHINANNSLGEVEYRTPFEVLPSHNFRFELGEGSGKKYVQNSNDDRPIVVFVRLGGMAYRYHFMMPNSPNLKAYNEVLKLLGPQGTRKKDGTRSMRKLSTNIETVRSKCPSLPTLLYPEEVDFTEL